MVPREIAPENLPEPANHNEGMTLAAWVTTGMIVLGVLIAAIGLMIPQFALLWVGGAVVVAGLIAGAVLRALGHGQPLK